MLLTAGPAVAGEPMFSGNDSRDVLKVFASPPRQFSTGPLWTWNDMLSEEDVRGTLRDLAGQQVKQAWVFPTSGLMTPYLTEEWFKLCRAALGEADKTVVRAPALAAGVFRHHLGGEQ